jgi:hypothetical protein
LIISCVGTARTHQDDSDEEVDHDHVPDDDKADEVHGRCTLVLAARVQQLLPRVAGGDAKQRQEREQEVLEVGVAVDALTVGLDGAEQRDT